MAFGIPTPDQLSEVIKTAISQATASGTQLEDSAIQALHDQLHASISEIIAGIEPFDRTFERLVSSLEPAMMTIGLLKSGLKITMEITPKDPGEKT